MHFFGSISLTLWHKRQKTPSFEQVPVILRLEDFGLELKRDAVSYIIEFVYRGEVNIPGERLTDVCQVKLEKV